MSTPTPGRTWVDSAPPLVPYRYGLFSVAAITDGEGPWQKNGVEYFTDHCAQGGYVQGMCPAPVTAPDINAQVDLDTAPGGMRISAPNTNTIPLEYAWLRDGTTVATGTLEPGETNNVPLPDGTYDLTLSYRGTKRGPFSIVVPSPGPMTLMDTFPANVTTHDKNVMGGPELAEGSDPFTIYARAQCNAVGFDDPRGMALTRLALVEQREAERFFSTRVLGAADPRYPAGGSGSPAVGLQQAIGLLEADAALNYAGQPTLHAPRWAAPFFDSNFDFGFHPDAGQTLRTLLGSPVAFGGGYSANPFGGAALPAGQFWLVATGSVRGWRGAAFANETFKTNDNTRMALAERTYAFDADCYRAAVLVAVGGA